MSLFYSKLALVFTLSTSALFGQLQEVENFTFEVSQKDLTNSSGKKITSGAGVIQQDRANFFKFKKKDAVDDAGSASYFKSPENRAKIPAMIAESLKQKLITKEDVKLLMEAGKIAHVTVSKTKAGKLVCTITITEAS